MSQEATSSIENNFWSSDKTALNILLDKLDQSNKTTNAIKDFFTERARIEQEYGNQLLKLSETFNIQHEEEFSIISNTTEMNARAHIDLGDNIKNLLELPLTDYVQDQVNIQTFMTNQMKESQNMKMLHGDNVKKTRQSYINECQKPTLSPKEAEVLDFEYRKAINLMQSNSPSWIHDWRESCKTFESLELNRLSYLKAVIKTFSSMTACAYSIDEQTCERLVTVMDDMNATENILKFISNHGTGSVLPDIPKYTKFKRNKEIVLKQEHQPIITIKEINIPTKHDEQLRSVNDQLKKIPNPWDNSDLNPKSSLPPHQYPLDPVYKSNVRQISSHSEPVLSNFTFKQDEKSVNHNQNKSTLVASYEEPNYQTAQHFLPWSTKSTTPTPRHISTKNPVPAPNRNSSSSVLTPPSPMFSQMDFYYSPSDNHHHNDLQQPHIC
ncbi:hypothetical protein INT47_012667 [Mucor saturninus]|uniref:FCH domain-containing protein n=1 Tax=Mucor saturninus TaxID=64648 RepID=A0A8H7QPW2_9FUNG|nr:hypothetical protein INT47_012667 [Mucor saturninus]